MVHCVVKQTCHTLWSRSQVRLDWLPWTACLLEGV